jgi:dimeric dUTPase (all-alpha-NTP-PPase superfamily)
MLYDRNNLIIQIRKLSNELGRLPTKKDILSCKWCASYSKFIKEFGSLAKIYEFASLDVPKWYFDNNEIIRLHVQESYSINKLMTITGKSKGRIYKILGNIRRDFRNEIKINSIQHEIIEGILISDGYIANRYKKACSLCIGQRSDRLEFIQYLSHQLQLEYNIYLIEPKPHWQAKVKNNEYRYSSKSYSFLKKYDERWYDNGGIKHIPYDFKITPTVLLYWYLGDGSFNTNNKTVRFSTCCFNQNDIILLIEQLKHLGLYSYITARNEIFLKTQSTNAFFEIIGCCPVKCFEYKWNKEKKLPSHRMTEGEKELILDLSFKHSINELSLMFGYTTAAIYRLIGKNR